VAVLPTGHGGLDEWLPDGGWPLGDTIELLTGQPGLGELGLLLPALAQATSAGRWAVLVDPPWIPYPPALRGHGVDLGRVLLVRTRRPTDALWACEQTLSGLRGGMVLAWPSPAVRFPQLRRLQLAARSGRQAVFLFRHSDAAAQAAPAALRLHLRVDDQTLQVSLLKGRGARPGSTVRLRHAHPAPRAMDLSRPAMPSGVRPLPEKQRHVVATSEWP